MALALDRYPDQFQLEPVTQCAHCDDFIYPGDYVHRRNGENYCSKGCSHDAADNETEIVCIDEVELC